MTIHGEYISVIRHDRFVGLWTYRPYRGMRKFCASVMVDGVTQETEMHDDWEDALRQADVILAETEGVKIGLTD